MGDGEYAGRDIAKWLDDRNFGSKARIGVINPSAGVTLDHEWSRMLPKGVSFHVTRLLLKQGTVEALDAMAAQVDKAAEILSTSHVHVICYGCTVGSLYRGIAGEKEIRRKVERSGGVAGVTMAKAAVEAIKCLGGTQIAVANPYSDSINETVRTYLEECGLGVAGITSMSIVDSWKIADLSPSDTVALGRRAVEQSPDADVLFLSCGNMRTIEAIEVLEREVGIPVVSSNQAMLWTALRVANVTTPVHGYGRLLRDYV